MHHAAGAGGQAKGRPTDGRSRVTFRRLRAVILALWTSLAAAIDVRFEPVAGSVYAHVGDVGARSVANEGLNANVGPVVTLAGAVLIDSGATWNSARNIHAAAKRVTAQPIRWVINTGGQDHRWLGNAYFQAQGAEPVAHATAVPDMRPRGGDQLAALRTLLGASADNTRPTLPTRLVDGPDNRLKLGGIAFELRHRGGGLTPGDMMVWPTQARVAFAGDIVYVNRLLAMLPVSNTRASLDTFTALEQRAPQRIVPGLGRVTDLDTARAQTKAYLEALRAHMKRAVEQSIDVSDAVKSFNAAPFLHLPARRWRR